MKFDLGFGNSVCVRQAFVQYSAPIHIGDMALNEMDYPPYDGDPELVELTKKVITRQTGHSFKHVVLTNGATGGVVLALRMYAQHYGYQYCITRRPPIYLRYPAMIATSGLIHKDEDESVGNKAIVLTDFPSNPLAKLTSLRSGLLDENVLDGVYFNRVYMGLVDHVPTHDIMIGSYSKLLGLNGIRIGWAATNVDAHAEKLQGLAKAEYCGLSAASTQVLLQSLRGFEWEAFESTARAKLDSNRTEWEKLERFFDYTPVSANGMFYYGSIDSAIKKLLEKAGVIWTTGSSLGASDDFGRFNLGQDCQLIKGAVAKILQLDKISK